MKKRILGRTGMEVGELSLGGAWLGLKGDKYKTALATVERALDLGINLIDTSADYGESEEAIGSVLHELGRPCIVTTKLGPIEDEDSFDPKDKDGLRKIVENSLKLLHTDQLDVLMIHEPDRPKQFDWYDNGRTFEGPVVDLLSELKEEGLIKYTGLGGTTAYEMVGPARLRCRY